VTLDRRGFLKAAGAGAGAVLASRPAMGLVRTTPLQRSPDVVVIGAGAFGGWTAFWLRRLGARVTLVDAYGPGNSRATSGDETRGVRSSYGDRPYPELWVRWAREAMMRWKAFDEEWSRQMKVRLYYTTGDLIFRQHDEPFTQRTREWWEKLGVPHEVLSPDDVVREHTGVVALKDIGVVLYEPDAGVVRARRACEVVAEAFGQQGGTVTLGTAVREDRDGTRLSGLQLSAPTSVVRGDSYVFALGPWFPKYWPALMGERIRTPMGYVHYFGTPPGDDRFTVPNLPSWNFPGVTGWPALPSDNRGFRVRWRGERLFDPDTSPRAFDRRHDRLARDLLRERFPLLRDAPVLETRACHYEISASRNFIIDRHPEMENVWIAGGGSAEGFKFGPVVGEYVAQRVLGDGGDPAVAESFSLRMSEPAPVEQGA
jgi:glycine/D-amino acid oxidase-like deaminating enzyme